MKTAVTWFDIPVTDFERAKKFYATVMGEELMDYPMPDDSLYSVFPYEQGQGIGGAIMKMDGFNPSTDGVIVYLSGGDDLSAPLARAEEAGAKVVIPKTSIGENGFMAHFIDLEGNRVALHSMN
ncbi:MAG: VOC family protein [Crocinitomicaceae bacterium]